MLRQGREKKDPEGRGQLCLLIEAAMTKRTLTNCEKKKRLRILGKKGGARRYGRKKERVDATGKKKKKKKKNDQIISREQPRKKKKLALGGATETGARKRKK